MNIELSYPVRFGIALALGFLVGLERESSEHGQKRRVYAGIRTYSILSLYGFGCAWLFQENITLAIPVGLLSVAGILLLEYQDKLKHDRIGWTSELSALLVFVTGALTLLTDIWVPLALGLVNTFLLTEKTELEQFVDRLDKTEFPAVLKFLLVTLIVLPVLPNQNYTQFNLNPTHIWEIVILVSSIGFVGYFLSKQFGEKVGLWLSGVLGGIISSTATSVALGRIAQHTPERSRSALQASILSSSVMYLRILFLIMLINPLIGYLIAWKMVVLSLVGILLATTIKKQPETSPEPRMDPKSGKILPNSNQNASVISPQNPFELKPALFFAVLFVLLTIITELVIQYLGNTALLGLSAVVGVTDIDPYVLSLVRSTQLPNMLMISSLLIAMMSNTITKGIYFSTLASRVRKEAWLRYGIWALLHLPLILLL